MARSIDRVQHALELSNLFAIIAGSLLVLWLVLSCFGYNCRHSTYGALTFTLPPTQAILMLSAIYCSGVYAGKYPQFYSESPDRVRQ